MFSGMKQISLNIVFFCVIFRSEHSVITLLPVKKHPLGRGALLIIYIVCFLYEFLLRLPFAVCITVPVIDDS